MMGCMEKRNDISKNPERDARGQGAPSRPQGAVPMQRSDLSGLIPRIDAARPASAAGPDAGGPTGFAPASPNRSGASSRGGAQSFLTEEAQAYARACYGAAAHDAEERKRRKRKNRIWTAVLVVAILVFMASVAVLGVIGYGYWSGTKTYDDVAAQAAIQKEADALSSMTVDWDALLSRNPDTVGWIYMPGTSIDYPIVQGETDEEYLKKDFAGETGGLVHKGSIFLSSDNAPAMTDQNNVIYGHNMNDDTMFAHILAMTEQPAFDAARTFYVFTPDRNYRCMTYAADIVDASQTSILQFDFPDRSSQDVYMAANVEGSTVAAPTDVDLSAATKLFTLITCGDDYAATRAVLFGAVVETAEPANAAS